MRKTEERRLTWKAALLSWMSETKMPVPVALWLPSMIMMPRPCIHSHHHHRHHHHVFVCHHQLALVHPQLPLGSELFELVRLKDLQNFRQE